MKTVNITLSEKAHKHLRILTNELSKNQNDVVTEVLENTEPFEYIKRVKG